MPYVIAPSACAARSAMVHSGHGLPMMATVSPAAIRYSRASPHASAPTREASARHVVSRQMPSAFARNATRSGRARARSTSKPGNVLARNASKFMPGGLYRRGGSGSPGRASSGRPEMVRPLSHLNAPVARSFARVTVPLLLDLLNDLREIVARRILHRRERHVGLELLEPQHLPDRQHVPVVEVGRAGGGKVTPIARYRLAFGADGRLER